ncbi:hypothetical protein GKR62_08500 [Yersinia pseudotuberculosis]|nr:hypothetical protein [Yersinia pseudotuberculosis]
MMITINNFTLHMINMKQLNIVKQFIGFRYQMITTEQIILKLIMPILKPKADCIYILTIM